MAGYCTIRGDVLDYDRRVEALSDPAYRLFMLTLYSRGRTMLGVMRFVAADALPRVRGWDESTAVAALAELQGVGLVAYDEEVRLLFNPLALEFAPIRGSNQVKGAAVALRDFPDSPVLLPALRQVLEAAKAAAQGKDPGRELPEIIAELQRRGETLSRLSPAAEPPARGFDAPLEPPSRVVEAPSEPPSRGLDAPSQGASGVGPLYSGLGKEPPTYCGQAPPPAGGLQGGSEGASRGLQGGSEGISDFSSRARARPEPDSEPEDPPKAPPPVPEGGAGSWSVNGGGRGAEGEGRYVHLDPRNRGQG